MSVAESLRLASASFVLGLQAEEKRKIAALAARTAKRQKQVEDKALVVAGAAAAKIKEKEKEEEEEKQKRLEAAKEQEKQPCTSSALQSSRCCEPAITTIAPEVDGKVFCSSSIAAAPARLYFLCRIKTKNGGNWWSKNGAKP
jgi:hypothetical protein